MAPSSSRGTVRKRSYTVKSGARHEYFEAELLIAKRPDGSWARISKSFGKQSEAKTWLQIEIGKRDEGVAQGSAVPTLAQLLDNWIAHLEAIDRTPATLYGYRSIIKAHLKPKLGHLRLDDRNLIAGSQRLVDDLAKARSPQTVHNVHGVLHTVLEFARRQKLVTSNAAADLDLPELRKREAQPLSVTDAHTFMEACRPHRLAPLMITTMAIGLRQSEAVGLRWSDIDMAAGSLTVRQRAYRRNGTVHVGRTKSPSSQRTIALPAAIVQLLREHRAELRRKQIVSLLVFPNMRGNHLYGPYVTRTMQEIMVKAGIPRHRFHDLRHTAATMLRAMGADIKEIQAVLGHSDYRLTADTYTHILDEARRGTAARMDAFLADPQAVEKRIPGNVPGNDGKSDEAEEVAT